MTDGILSLEDQQERLSEVYVSTVALSAGYSVAKSDLDRDGIDLQLRAGGGMLPQIDIQLKATYTLGEPQSGMYRYPLKVRNYNLLRLETLVPRILILYHMPKEFAQWAVFEPESLTLRRCAFWVNLAGLAETANSATVTIDVPANNIFNVSCLKSMMDKTRRGERI